MSPKTIIARTLGLDATPTLSAARPTPANAFAEAMIDSEAPTPWRVDATDLSRGVIIDALGQEVGIIDTFMPATALRVAQAICKAVNAAATRIDL